MKGLSVWFGDFFKVLSVRRSVPREQLYVVHISRELTFESTNAIYSINVLSRLPPFDDRVLDLQ